MNAQQPVNIAICISTYKRPDGLRSMLDSLDRLARPGFGICVFVADNDSDLQEGLATVEAVRGRYGFDVLCEVEPSPGISHARNRALDMVRRHPSPFDYIALTDDDAFASTQWLADMVETFDLYGADVVFGKMEFRFAEPPPPEILYHPFFHEEGDSGTTGKIVHDGGTCNVVLKRKVFEECGWQPFDPALSLSGGEDTAFFTLLNQRQYKMIYCASAVVYEVFPKSRLTKDWFLKRYYRRGSTEAFFLKKHKGAAALYIRALKKLARMPFQFVRYRLTKDLARQCYLYDSFGFFYFVLTGKTVEEYSRSGKTVLPGIPV